jgi:hypothetical protein
MATRLPVGAGIPIIFIWLTVGFLTIIALGFWMFLISQNLSAPQEVSVSSMALVAVISLYVVGRVSDNIVRGINDMR